MGEVGPITQFCFAMEILGLARLLLGNRGEPQWMEGQGQALTSYDVSSLVIDRLCDWMRGQSAMVGCFYFDFAAQKEQSPTSMLGALLRQLVSGLDETPEEILRVYRHQKSAVGRRGPRLADIVRMLQTITSKKPTFICVDALDECAVRYRVEILDSLHRILQKSPNTRIFITGRPHIQFEVQKRLSGGAAICATPLGDDIISYLHSRLDEDTIPDAMDSSLKADILRIIPKEM